MFARGDVGRAVKDPSAAAYETARRTAIGAVHVAIARTGESSGKIHENHAKDPCDTDTSRTAQHYVITGRCYIYIH